METEKKFTMLSLLSYGRRKRKVEKYAGFNRRMMASTIDSILLIVCEPLVEWLAPLREDALAGFQLDPQDPQLARHYLNYVLTNQAYMQSWVSNFMVQILIWCVFSAICLHFWSATPGKMLLRMKVVDAKTERRINDLQVFLRSFGYLISTVFLCLGFVWIGLTRRKRGWHDYLADTVVINLPMYFWRKPVTLETLETSET